MSSETNISLTEPRERFQDRDRPSERARTLAKVSDDGINSGMRSSSSCRTPGRGVGGGMRYDMVRSSGRDRDGRIILIQRRICLDLRGQYDSVEVEGMSTKAIS
jgi:hypothetical protein